MSEWLKLKTLMKAYVGEDVKLGEHSFIVVGVKTCIATLEVSMAISQKVWNQSTSGSSNTTFGYIPIRATFTPQGHLLS